MLLHSNVNVRLGHNHTLTVSLSVRPTVRSYSRRKALSETPTKQTVEKEKDPKKAKRWDMDDEKSSMYGRGGQRFRQSDNQPIEHLLSSLATSLTSISVLMPKAVDNFGIG